MKIETAHNVVNVQQDKIITTRYEQWVNPATNKHEQRVLVYTVDLYTKQGQAQTHSNQHSINQLV
jgi:hypothetical protein